MATLKELAYELAELMGKPFDTAVVAQNAFNIKAYRSFIIKQEMNKKRRLDPVYLQTINCVEFEYKDLGDCCGVCTGEMILRSKEEIPKALVINGGSSFRYVGGLDFKTAYQETNLLRIAAPTKSRFGNLVPEYFYQDDRLYLRNTTAKVAVVQGIFEEPEKVYELQCKTEDTTSNNCDPLDVEFPAPADVLVKMWNAMLGGKYRMKQVEEEGVANVNIQ